MHAPLSGTRLVFPSQILQPVRLVLLPHQCVDVLRFSLHVTHTAPLDSKGRVSISLSCLTTQKSRYDTVLEKEMIVMSSFLDAGAALGSRRFVKWSSPPASLSNDDADKYQFVPAGMSVAGRLLQVSSSVQFGNVVPIMLIQSASGLLQVNLNGSLFDAVLKAYGGTQAFEEDAAGGFAARGSDIELHFDGEEKLDGGRTRKNFTVINRTSTPPF